MFLFVDCAPSGLCGFDVALNRALSYSIDHAPSGLCGFSVAFNGDRRAKAESLVYQCGIIDCAPSGLCGFDVSLNRALPYSIDYAPSGLCEFSVAFNGERRSKAESLIYQ